MSESDANSFDERELIALVRAVAAKFLSLPNVTSIGVGRKVTGGVTSDRLAVQFTTEVKLRPEELSARGLVALPTELRLDDGRSVPTDVLARRFRRAHRVTTVEPRRRRHSLEALQAVEDRQRRRDPLVGGISVSIDSGTAGTLGLIVRDRRSGRPLILSNWHVLHGSEGRIHDAVVQPGAWDAGGSSDGLAGRLLRSHLGVEGDCAVATVENRRFTTGLMGLAATPRRIAQVEIGDSVVKSGRTTGVTHGRVVRVGVLTRIDYGVGTGLRTVGGFEIGLDPEHAPADGELSSGGDSGSCWMIANGGGATDILAGLHFAGEASDTEEHALACNIDEVMRVLDIELFPEAIGGDRHHDTDDSGGSEPAPTLDPDDDPAPDQDEDDRAPADLADDLSMELLLFLATYLRRQAAEQTRDMRSVGISRRPARRQDHD